MAAALASIDAFGAGAGVEDAQDATIEVADLEFKKQLFDLQFHPSARVLAASTVTGRVHVYRHACEDGAPHEKLYEATHHSKAARCLAFSADGRALFSGGSDGALRVLDAEAMQLCGEQKEARGEVPLNVLRLYDANTLCSGDDDGTVKVWDARAPQALRCAMSFSEHGDFVADLWAEPGRHQLLCAGGDGHLSVYDMRGKGECLSISEGLDDELLSLVVLKEGRKVVCGSQDGVLQIYSYGQFGDIDDRFPGHPQSVDTMVKVDEDTVATGSSDGLIRLVSIHPNKLLGVLGEHEEFPIEVIRKNYDNTFMASCSHDKRIKFWDVRYLYEEDDDEDEDGDDAAGDDDMGGAAGAAPQSRRLQSSKESFFDGL